MTKKPTAFVAYLRVSTVRPGEYVSARNMSCGGVSNNRQAAIICTLGQPKTTRAEAAIQLAQLAEALRRSI
jgi:hypothetical protein